MARLELEDQLKALAEAQTAEAVTVQRELSDSWRRLLENDPLTVIETLDDAFDDNAAPAVPVDVDGSRVTVVLLVGSEDLIPERQVVRTPSGGYSARSLSKTERADYYVGWIASHSLATVREVFAVAPAITDVTIVAIRHGPSATVETLPVEMMFVGTYARSRFMLIDFSADSTAVLNAAFDAADELTAERKGRIRELVPIEIGEDAGMRSLLGMAGAALSTRTTFDGLPLPVPPPVAPRRAP